MFNQEIKERYIASRAESMHNEYRNYFVASEPFEEQFGKDVACFTVEEIDQFLRRYGFCEPHTVRNRVAKLSSYSAWYGEQFGSADNAFKKYDIVQFPYAELLKPTLTFSANDLVNRILQVYDADSGQSAIAALCLAWLGIDGKTAISLKKEQVDTAAGRIYDATGGLLVSHMPEEIRGMLQAYSKTQSAIRVQNRTFEVYADDRGLFIKRFITANSGKAGKPISVTQLSEWIGELHDRYANLFGDDAAISLNLSNVLRSGGLHRLRELDKANVDVRSNKSADSVCLCLGASKRSHKDNMLLYDAYLECIGEK